MERKDELYWIDLDLIITTRWIHWQLLCIFADSYVHEDERGVHPEVEFIFDLKLPEDFEPINADGEVQEFKLYPVSQVIMVNSYECTEKHWIAYILYKWKF